MEGKKVPCSIQKENFKLIIYIFGGGKEEISFINEILLTLLSYEYFWMILRFMAYSCESL